MYIPTETEIQQIMRETGMDYVQAYRHAKQRGELRARLNRR
jgi:hypothetical protein